MGVWCSTCPNALYLVALQGGGRQHRPYIITSMGLSMAVTTISWHSPVMLQQSGFSVPTLPIIHACLPTLKDTYPTTLTLDQCASWPPLHPLPAAMALPPLTPSAAASARHRQVTPVSFGLGFTVTPPCQSSVRSACTHLTNTGLRHCHLVVGGMNTNKYVTSSIPVTQC